MNENDFLQKWSEESSMYDAWGRFVTTTICKKLELSGLKINAFLKQPPAHRVKDDNALIDKAFYRPNKNYVNPYIDIEDKVGCRFVVLLVEQIDILTSIITEETIWNFKECRHFSTEREREPLLFTYQSVHYVVRPKLEFEYNGVLIQAETPCEIQVRTLLQHAYAELTHDAVYKAKKLVEPGVHRTVAKSMALIETTDDFFSDVNNKLTSDTSSSFNFQEQLDVLYETYVGNRCYQPQKSSIIILDQFDDIIDQNFFSKLETFLNQRPYLADAIRIGRQNNPFYNQSVVLFVYYLIKKKKNLLLNNWPLNIKIIEHLGVDIGASFDIN